MWREKIERWLEEEGRKKSWLAREVGVSRTTISYWLQGKAFPHAKHIRKLLQIVPHLRAEDFFPESRQNFSRRNGHREVNMGHIGHPNTARWGLGVLERRDRNTPARAEVVGSEKGG